MTGVRTPVPPLCVCEFMMVLSSRLSKKKKKRIGSLNYVRRNNQEKETKLSIMDVYEKIEKELYEEIYIIFYFHFSFFLLTNVSMLIIMLLFFPSPYLNLEFY